MRVVKVKSSDLQDLVWCSVMYALSRKNHIAVDMTELVTKYKSNLTSAVKILLIYNIQNALDSDDGWMGRYRVDWQKVTEELKKD